MKTRLLFGLVAALALAACGRVDQSSPDASGEERPPSAQSLSDFLACARQWTVDYEPVDTPALLAKEADLTVTGTMVDVKPGQLYAPNPASDAQITTSVLEVEVDRVLAGDEAIVADGSVYVELQNFDHAACPTVPRSYGVFFLTDTTNEPYLETILDEGAGRPAGARITVTFVQGFLIEDAAGKLVSVWESFEAMPPAWEGLGSVDEVVAEIG